MIHLHGIAEANTKSLPTINKYPVHLSTGPQFMNRFNRILKGCLSLGRRDGQLKRCFLSVEVWQVWKAFIYCLVAKNTMLNAHRQFYVILWVKSFEAATLSPRYKHSIDNYIYNYICMCIYIIYVCVYISSDGFWGVIMYRPKLSMFCKDVTGSAFRSISAVYAFTANSGSPVPQLKRGLHGCDQLPIIWMTRPW